MIDDYESRIKSQIKQYKEVENIHDLPGIFHYWSNKYLRPRMNDIFKADSIIEFYARPIIELSKKIDTVKIISIGSGDCSIEIQLCQYLVENNILNYECECAELSPLLIERAKDEISNNPDISEKMLVSEVDLNKWEPNENSTDIIMANHSLHHMVELENIFDRVKTTLKLDGIFITIDMIGRNGHMRWPEVKCWIDKIWPILPDYIKYNHQLNRMEKEFLDWDCSVEGFEGIRAQDILPLLLERFNFKAFLAHGGIIDPFIDRGFGHNLDNESQYDKNLIDYLQFLNDRLIDLDEIKPTMMFAVMKVNDEITNKLNIYKNWTPMFCKRDPY